MARQMGPTVEILMRRVRQEGGLAVAPNFATEIYSRCEQVVNTYIQRVTATTTLTTAAEQLLYHYRTEITDAIDILEVRESGKRLEKCDSIIALSAYDIDWFRKVDGTAFNAWCQIGRDILIIYPGKASASSVTVKYVQLLALHTDFTTSYNTDSELPDEDIEFALQLAELVLMARFRQVDKARELIGVLGGVMQ